MMPREESICTAESGLRQPQKREGGKKREKRRGRESLAVGEKGWRDQLYPRGNSILSTN